MRAVVFSGARILFGVAVLLAIIWHTLPVVVWHVSLRPELNEMPAAARLRIETVTEFPSVPADWREVVVGNLSVSIPPTAESGDPCAAADANCFVPLGTGTLNVFGRDYLESYRELVNLRAPDERDISLRYSANANWRTIRALRARVETSRSKLDAFRFENTKVKGIVAATRRGDTERWIVAAYSLDERSSRGIGLAGRTEQDLLSLLGSVDLLSGEPQAP